MPENLAQLVTAGLLLVDTALTFHAAAAALVLTAPAYDALLVDAEVLARRHVQMLRLIKRHTSLPLWYVPASRGYGPSPEAFPPGALPVDQAIRALQDSRLHDSTQGPGEGNKENFSAEEIAPPPPPPLYPPYFADQTATKRHSREPVAAARTSPARAASPRADSENKPPESLEKRTEIPVAEGLAPGYDAPDHAPDPSVDGPINGPLLTAPEIRALLGTSD